MPAASELPRNADLPNRGKLIACFDEPLWFTRANELQDLRHQWAVVAFWYAVFVGVSMLPRFSAESNPSPLAVHLVSACALWFVLFGFLFLSFWFQPHRISVFEEGISIRRGGIRCFYPWRVFEGCDLGRARSRGRSCSTVRLILRYGGTSGIVFDSETTAGIRLGVKLSSTVSFGIEGRDQIAALVGRLEHVGVRISDARSAREAG